jgi:hypothetical protein
LGKLPKPGAICKTLSANDTGETGSHQAGMLIPKQEEILSFFPVLNRNVKNPRVLLIFEDPDGGMWKFSFIYYNNRLFGGTRNEYRLTGMTAFIRMNDLKAGDTVILQRDSKGKLLINYKRLVKSLESKRENVLRLGNSWRVVHI